MMEFLFGRRKTVTELIGEQRDTIRKAQRKAERDIVALQMAERGHSAQLKAAIRRGAPERMQHTLARQVFAKQRGQQQLAGAALQLDSMLELLTRVTTEAQMQEAMVNTNRLMARLNAALPGATAMRMAAQWSSTREQMKMKQEQFDTLLEEGQDDGADDEDDGSMEAGARRVLEQMQDTVTVTVAGDLSGTVALDRRRAPAPADAELQTRLLALAAPDPLASLK